MNYIIVLLAKFNHFNRKMADSNYSDIYSFYHSKYSSTKFHIRFSPTDNAGAPLLKYQPFTFFTTSKGSYDVKMIREALSKRQWHYLFFCHAFTGCDTVSSFAGHGINTLFDKFCAGDIDEHIDTVIRSGTAIFKYIYNASGTTLGEIRYNMFAHKAAVGLIKPETVPPTEGAAAQHSLHVYLQTQNWMLLQSMSLNPDEYGWTIRVPILDTMAPEELLWFTSCNCHEDCSTQWCSYKNGVQCISACGIYKGITCKNCINDAWHRI